MHWVSGMRTILHSDMNNFYASVECVHHPELLDKPVVVGGDPELRHGIVLAKNMLAKATGIKTGEALWIARQKCPGLTVVPAHYPLYLRYAQLARKIYADYTDRVEPFGLDEAWLDGAWLVVAATVAVQLGGSIALILGRAGWLAAGALGVFTALATLIAHPYWTVADPVERFHAMNTFLEHIGLIGGFMLAILENLVSLMVPNGTAMVELAAYGLMIFVLLIRPGGLMGVKEA